ncbi:MAG: CGGC domain-containing protein [Anaerovibrio sp.]|uniref:CGGC domain-containing protein n=1 Tax=Anaerovibrio sp. TaxID=1872532 RepID=UPI0025E01F5A|nr:CGGC domain-containing protein [Anaerovibrio sp.]MCR5177234.1 CGGC domain-containing protein [Anaerovibrio sp.]
MKKIAILRCLDTSAACAGTGCLRAFNEKSEGFKGYAGQEVQLAAMWTCNGCGDNKLANQEGIEKKIARMVKNNISAVHVSHCTCKKNAAGEEIRCPVIIDICRKLEVAGVAVIDGTHGQKATGERLKLS